MTQSEKLIYDYLTRKGFKVFHNGWPDFLAVDEQSQKAYLIEVKLPKEKLNPNQIEMHKWLTRLGIPVYTIREKKELLNANGKPLIQGKQFLTIKVATEINRQLEDIEYRFEFSKAEIKKQLNDFRQYLKACEVFLELTYNTDEVQFTKPYINFEGKGGN